VDIYREPGMTPRDGEWVFVPLEIVCRHYLAGSGWRRYKRGELTSEELGFEAGTVLEQGAKLPAPYVEVTTKFEAFDRLIDTAEALEIANITSEELESLIDVVIKVDALIEREALKNGLIHVDGKKEFALGPGRVPVLVDSFGTLDEDRWWDADEYANGNIVQLSKEFVRQHYVRTGHQEDLRLARESDSTEPPIPALPSEVIADTAALYASMYQRLTGNEF
jgi:phosphoribosylaminoimidazole-succinocarboxamide synthase